VTRKAWLRLLGGGAVVALYGACVGQGTGAVMGEVHVKACDNRTDFNRPDATHSAYNMNPDFFAGEPIEDIHQDGFPMNRLEIRVQASSGNIGQVITSLDRGAGIDTLFVSISDVRAVAQLVGQPIELHPIVPALPAAMPPPPVRVALQLLGSCPFSSANYLPADTGQAPAQHTSTITFSQFGGAKAGADCNTPGAYCPAPDFKVDFGDTIAATFDLSLIDLRFLLGLEPNEEGFGHVSGNFSFELRRGAAGQIFP
jgi:hypothetical protein